MFIQGFKFNVLAFMTALCVGLLYTYYTSDTPKMVYKWPTPYNAGKTIYKDDNEVCFKYHIKKVKCLNKTEGVKVQ